MKRWLYKSSENTSSHASVVLRWLGVRWDLHPDLRDFLVKQGLEVYRLDRNGDTLLQISPTWIAEYMREARMAISTLIHRWKDVHLFWISFWAYLTLRLASEIQNKISSIVALAPLIEPWVTIASRIEKIEPSRMRVIKLSNSQSFRIWII